MNAKELVEYLDGAGLVITDEELLDEELATLPINPEHQLDQLGELLEAVEDVLKHCALPQKVWGDGAINVTPVIERLNQAVAKAKGKVNLESLARHVDQHLLTPDQD